MNEAEKLQLALAAQENLRAVLSDEVVDAAINAIRLRIEALETEAPPTQQQRRQATILFADISGFTTLSEQHDAEHITHLMNDLWQTLDAAILNEGGLIDKHIGDEVMAVWGGAVAREDDPQRAVTAALDMHRRLAAFSRQRDLDLKMRIGINTGPVLFGEVGTTGEVTSMGDAVNLASRLEHAAPVGGTLISHFTYQHIRGLFDTTILDPIDVKGKESAVQVYTVEGRTPRRFQVTTRGVQGIQTRMIGRKDELNTLQHTWDEVIATHTSRLLTIAADAGVGKSRLIYEFLNRQSPSEITILQGRATPNQQNLPYALLRSTLAAFFDIKEDDDLPTIKRQLENSFIPLLTSQRGSAQERTQYIAHLLGFYFADSIQNKLSDSEKFRDMARFYLAEFFRALTQNRPVLLVLDDIHWADNPTLDTLKVILELAPDIPLFIIGMTRPTLFHSREDYADFDRITLDPLKVEESEALVDEILQRVQAIPTDLRSLIVERADGNPLYVEEFINKLIQDDIIRQRGQQWAISLTSIDQIEVPATVRGILQGRLDTLPTDEQTVLQQSSVVGPTFWSQAVVYLAEQADQAPPDIHQQLRHLQARQLTRPQVGSTFRHTQEYIFKHEVLHDVTYESVLISQRQVLHQRAAEWLIARSDEIADAPASAIAQHFAKSTTPEKAVPYFITAGDNAAEQAANEDAKTSYQAAYDLLDENDTRQRAHVLNKLGHAVSHLGQYDAAHTHFETSLALARELEDETIAVDALRGLAYVAQRQSDYEEASTYAKQGLAQASDDRLKAELLSILGHVEWEQGNYDEAEAYHQQSLDAYQTIDYKPGIAKAQIDLFAAPFFQGDHEEASKRAKRGLQTAREVGNKRLEGIALNYLGASSASSGNLQEARDYMLESLQIQQEIGDRGTEVFVLNNLGAVSDDLGRYEEAQNYYRRSLEISEAVGSQRGAALALANLGSTTLALNNLDAALSFCKRSIELADTIGSYPEMLAAMGVLAQILAEKGDENQAAQISVFVLNHQATMQQTKQDIEDLLESLNVDLKEEEAKTAQHIMDLVRSL